MTGESYSSWFLRFLDTFLGRADRAPASVASREQWLATFADALHGERVEAEAHEPETVAADEGESSSSSGYSARQPAREEEKPRYRQMGGEDL